MTDVNSVLAIKRFDEFGNGGSICVHIIAVHRLSGATVPAPIMSDHSVAARQKKHHLGVPVISGQRPTMMEKDRLAGTPIFVINLSPVFHCDRVHICSPLSFFDSCFVSNLAKPTALTGH